MNQFATPGLGSLMGRRLVAGMGQLCIFVAGFVFFLVWFVEVMRGFYGQMFDYSNPYIRHWLAWIGICLCAFGWLWALVTSISLIREAKQNERDGKLAAVADRMGPPPRLQP